MKIIDKIKNAMEEDKPFYSFEFFPPKTDSGSHNLLARLERMSELHPLFIDITWGAGGKSSDRTMLISSGAQNYIGLETMMHLTCTNQTLDEVRGHIAKAKEEGIQNILALRGDAPEGDSKWVATDRRLQYSTDLVKLIREEHGDYFGIAVAGYPYGHPECASYEEDLVHLKEKVDAGADFIVSQLFFDVEVYLKFERDCREIGIECPILPGVLPIQGYASLRHLSKMASTPIPEHILTAVEAIKNDDAAIRDYGVAQATAMIRKLHENGVLGVHFYTLNREVSVTRIVEELSLNPTYVPRELPWTPSTNIKRQQEMVRPIFWANRAKSYLVRTRSWDEFPNGRWGDSASPAFDELAEYHIFAVEKKHKPEALRDVWGEAPTHAYQIFEVFAKFIQQEVPFLPWVDNELALETGYIRDQLLRLNLAGFLTINSQPAVNGAPSSDKILGWGPENGYVYQKAYVEMFCSPALLAKLEAAMPNYPHLTYHAVDVHGNKASNNPENSTTAVTWGVFPKREIVQPTVVDPLAFDHWKDEAFGLWLSKWLWIYEEGSKSREVIQTIHDTYWLVNIVDNDYIHGDVFAIFNEILEEDGLEPSRDPPRPSSC